MAIKKPSKLSPNHMANTLKKAMKNEKRRAKRTVKKLTGGFS